MDINECLASSLCNGDRQFCENAQPGFDCSCFIGYSGDNCTDINDDSKTLDRLTMASHCITALAHKNIVLLF